MRRNCAFLCFYAVALLQFASAQTPASKSDPPCPPKIENISDGVKNALACEWINAPQHALKALEFYVIPTRKEPGGEFLDPHSAPQLALQELIVGAPTNEDLYRAAQGRPNAEGQPTAQGLTAFVDTLAKANTLNLKKPDDEDKALKDAQDLICILFNEPRGKQDLVKINDAFSQGANQLALFELLNAFPAKNKMYALNLEKLRAAYAINASRLAKLVANTISPANQ